VRIPIESATSYRGRNSRPNWLGLLASVALALAAGGIGAFCSPLFSPSSAAWYASLVKPPWIPVVDGYGIALALLFLYALMGGGAWLIWQERYHRGRNTATFAYAVQLLLNAAWAPVFFGANTIGGGLFVIVAVWLALAWTIRDFAVVRPIAAWMLVPMLVTAGAAATLCLNLWRHNQ
jgi:translocator protein